MDAESKKLMAELLKEIKKIRKGIDLIGNNFEKFNQKKRYN